MSPRYRIAPESAGKPVQRLWDDWDGVESRTPNLTVYEPSEPWRGIGIIDPGTGRELQRYYGSEPMGFLSLKSADEA